MSMASTSSTSTGTSSEMPVKRSPSTLGLRDMLSSMVEAHLHLYPSSASLLSPHSPSRYGGSHQRRPSRIRSWISGGGGDQSPLPSPSPSPSSRSRFHPSDGSESEGVREEDSDIVIVSHEEACRRFESDEARRGRRNHHHTDTRYDYQNPTTAQRSNATNAHPTPIQNANRNTICNVPPETAATTTHVHHATTTQLHQNQNQIQNKNKSANENKNVRNKMHMLPDQIREEEMLDMLFGVLGDDFDREVARRVLRKYDGNVDKAAGALLEGERGDEPVATGQGQGLSSWPMGSASSGQMQTQTPAGSQTRLDVPSALAGRPNTPIIDLTLDDDPDLKRAMQESMNTLQPGAQAQLYSPSYSQSQSQLYAPSYNQVQAAGQMQVSAQPEKPVFGPSERPSDPNWAVVPSHQHESNDAYLQNLNRAIEASLETMGDSDALEPFPVEQQLRRDGCPVVLRPSLHTMVYAASILQGLFYVPQVRERMACWRPVPPNQDEVTPPMSGPDFTLWALSEIFTHMDLARLCDLNVDKRLPAFNIEPWDRPAQPPGELSRKFFARLSETLEKAFIDQFAHSGQPPPKPRLLHFQYGNGIKEPGEVLQETSIVPIDVNGGESNDLIGRLSAQLSKSHTEIRQSVIIEPSEVVAFELVRSSMSNSTASGAGVDRKPFRYPQSIYLDQFLRENVELAQAKRTQRQAMLEEVQQLVLHKKTLTHFDNKDTLKDLRSAIFYFENVADAKDDVERGTSIQATAKKLKSILNIIEEGIKVADEKIDTLRTQAETLLDCDELRQFKYDLRVVFVHDGLYGRKHLYSYVHDKSCWWKIANSLIEKVPEDLVLNDQAGLHLGAGPYLLFYSRATPEGDLEGSVPVLPWMDDIKDDVKAANREFLSQLPLELVGDIALDEGLNSGSSVLKNGERGEGSMDLS